MKESTIHNFLKLSFLDWTSPSMKAYSTKIIDLTRSPTIVARVPPSPRRAAAPVVAAEASSSQSSDKWDSLTEEQVFVRHREHSAAGRIYETRCRVCTDPSAKRRFEEGEEARKMIERRREAHKLLAPPPEREREPERERASSEATSDADADDGSRAETEAEAEDAEGVQGAESRAQQELESRVSSAAATLVWSGRVIPLEPVLPFDAKAMIASGPFQPQVIRYFSLLLIYSTRLHVCTDMRLSAVYCRSIQMVIPKVSIACTTYKHRTVH